MRSSDTQHQILQYKHNEIIWHSTPNFAVLHPALHAGVWLWKLSTSYIKFLWLHKKTYRTSSDSGWASQVPEHHHRHQHALLSSSTSTLCFLSVQVVCKFCIVNILVCAQVPVCVCVCVCVCLCLHVLRIVSLENILCFINTLTIMISPTCTLS